MMRTMPLSAVEGRSHLIAIAGTVYDLSSFSHPGGDAALRPHMGSDATTAFLSVHGSAMLSQLAPFAIARLENAASSASSSSLAEAEATREQELLRKRSALPPLSSVLNVRDMAPLCERVLAAPALAFYNSAADDEVTLRENEAAYTRWMLRPRVLRNVSVIDTSVTTVFGDRLKLPLFLSPTSIVRLADPMGEVAVVKAAAAAGAIYMIPSLSSCPLEEIVAAAAPARQWYQLYVDQDRSKLLPLLRRVEASGVSAIFLTVDSPILGNRERDLRVKFEGITAKPEAMQTKEQVSGRGVAASIGFAHDPTVDWEFVRWLMRNTTVPVCLKGVQCGEDAVEAARLGVRAVVVSNHGARQLDYSRGTLDVLEECVAHLRAAGASLELYVDGGVRRGTDVFKALALGARAVGLGRPVLHALGAYGPAGVTHMLGLLERELVRCCMLMGVTSLSQIGPHCLVRRHRL